MLDNNSEEYNTKWLKRNSNIGFIKAFRSFAHKNYYIKIKTRIDSNKNVL